MKAKRLRALPGRGLPQQPNALRNHAIANENHIARCACGAVHCEWSVEALTPSDVRLCAELGLLREIEPDVFVLTTEGKQILGIAPLACPRVPARATESEAV